jgi:molybdenum-dependent DNA-binding transcriptional regulator ModE
MLGTAERGLMRIDPKHLMIIAEISDAGGFTEAALSLGTSQPAISRVVKMLEQRLGEPIRSSPIRPCFEPFSSFFVG